MNFEERVRHLFGLDIESKIALVDTTAIPIALAAQRLIDCLLNDGKLLICGNGGSAANCLHFSTALVNRFDVERPSLPVIALTADVSIITAIANEGHFDQCFARQILALGQPQDVLIVLSTHGNSNSMLQAIDAAHDKGIDVVVLNGRDGGVLVNHLGPEDIELRIPYDNPARIREIHLFILHCFCDLIDRSLFGHEA
ncbi:MAG: SIS domain-containing protein [Legionellaceae bacterium]|nr:SIS domain-containing protein [Legionellaceae bacterium]